jgi:pyruvate/2-oxoglutarate dehydrogenase complex dihydrolipoamide dehydrogenase (E3) component
MPTPSWLVNLTEEQAGAQGNKVKWRLFPWTDSGRENAKDRRGRDRAAVL